MPKTNSHKYCKKKLFHTRISFFPNTATIVAYARLTNNAYITPLGLLNNFNTQNHTI